MLFGVRPTNKKFLFSIQLWVCDRLLGFFDRNGWSRTTVNQFVRRDTQSLCMK